MSQTRLRNGTTVERSSRGIVYGILMVLKHFWGYHTANGAKLSFRDPYFAPVGGKTQMKS